MNFNIYNTLIIAGIIQGFLFAIIVLSTKKYRFKSVIFLVLLIILYSLSNLQYLIADIGIMSYVNMYSYYWLPLSSVLTPVFYLYYANYLNPSKSKITAFEKLLFLPFLVFLSLTIIYRIGIINGSSNLNFENLYMNVIRINEIFSVFFCLTFLIIPLIQAYLSRNKQPLYNINYVRPNLNWMYATFILLGLLTIYWAFLTYRNLFTEEKGLVNYYYFWVCVSISIYWLGYMGIYKFGILNDRKKIRNYNISKLEIAHDINIKNKYVVALQTLLIKDRIFLDPKLTLETVAEKLKLSKSYLSKIISSELDTSFTDYLNSFRIKEAKDYLNNPNFSNYTIVAIGLEAGFNSKSSFFEVFKKATGMTPLAYKRKVKKQIKIEAS